MSEVHERRRRRALGLLTAGALAATTTALGGTASPSAAVPGGTYAVTGTVTAEGTSFDGALLNFFQEADDGSYLQYDATYPQAGAFEIPLEDGRYKLKVEDTTAFLYESEWYDDQDSIEAAEVIVVQDGGFQLDDIDLELPPGITGVVKDAVGQVVKGVTVRAHDASLAGNGQQDSDYTGDDGVFHVDPGPGNWKLEISDDAGRYATEWYADRASAAEAQVFILAADTGTSIGDVTITPGGSISGRVARLDDTGIQGIAVTALDSAGDRLAFDRTDAAGDYTIPRLAAGSYDLLFEDSYSGFEPEYYDGAETLETATPVLLREDEPVTGRNAVLELTDELTNLVPPTISGRPVVGRTLQASPGSWNRDADAEYTYEWLNAAAVVGTGPAYTTRGSDAGDRLRVRVTSRIGNSSGTATSAATGVVKRTSRTALKGVDNARRNKVRLIARIVVQGVSNPGGTVRFKEGRSSLAKSVRVRNGKATFTVKRVARGRHTYTAVYSGTASVTKSKRSVTVRAR